MSVVLRPNRPTLTIVPKNVSGCYLCPECEELVEGKQEIYDVDGEVSVMIYCEYCGKLLHEYLIPKMRA